LSDRIIPAGEPAVWTPNPLLSGKRQTQTPHFLRTQWDEATARSFGPWRVAEPVEPTSTQTVTALQAEPQEAELPEAEDTASAAAAQENPAPPAEPQNAWSDAAIAALREQAFLLGVQEGQRQAQEQWEAEKQKEGEILRHLGIELRSLQQDPQRFFEPLKRLSLHIAEQWVRGELQVSGRAVEQMVRQCLEQLEPAGQKVHVELNPADLARLKALGDEATHNMELQADAQLREGSVRVRVNESVVQDLIEHRLEAMARKLLKDPESWLQQSALLHPEKFTDVDEQETLRKWTRRTIEVEDAPARTAHTDEAPRTDNGSQEPPAEDL
jgi:flagellar biosynthesis/type III secretory pathway protein FliH